MKVTAEDFRRRYADLSDEGLLAIDPNDLTDVARKVYDEELARRGLAEEARAPEAKALAEELPLPPDLVPLAKFNSVEDAEAARAMLEDEGITARLETDFPHLVSDDDPDSGCRLLISPDERAAALEILFPPISEEELAAQAEAAGPAEEEMPEQEEEEST